MNKKTVAFASLCFILQSCFVTGFPKPGNPYEIPGFPGGSGEEDSSNNPPPLPIPKHAKNAAKHPAKAAKAATEDNNLPRPSSVNELPSGGGGPPSLTPEAIEALVRGIQQNFAPSSLGSTPPPPPPPPPADPSKPDYTQVLNLVAANAQNPEALKYILKNVPNPADFAKSLVAWLVPTAKITQNTIDGLANIHMQNRQAGVDLMRTATEPLAMISRLAMAPFGQSQRVDMLRSASMKGISDIADNTFQFSKIAADAIPEGIQSLNQQANGLFQLKTLTF